MSEEVIVRHCSPTLAGMKTGSLFSSVFRDMEELRDTVRRFNRVLVKKGLRILPLRYREGHALLYLYRPAYLTQDLAKAEVRRLLKERGYDPQSPDRCVLRLIERLKTTGDFPHEIGLFLGYPPEDVRGFIENRAGKCKCVGCWKVYGNEQAARALFLKYRRCTEAYCVRLRSGIPVERLAVADRSS